MFNECLHYHWKIRNKINNHNFEFNFSQRFTHTAGTIYRSVVYDENYNENKSNKYCFI